MTTTARDIVKTVLRKISELGTGQDLDANDANDVLNCINGMISVWSVEGNAIFTETRETFSLTSTGSYTIGSGADFDTERPVRIITAYTSSGGIDYPLTIINEKQYARISDKTTTGIPTHIFYDGNYPTATIKLWPVPSGVQTITIYSEKPLVGFESLDTVYNIPPEYRSAIENNGAVQIAPEYDREASPTVKSLAMTTLATIKAQNKKNNPPRSRINAPLRANDYNYYYDVNRGY